jgi:hypothetical protein
MTIGKHGPTVNPRETPSAAVLPTDVRVFISYAHEDYETALRMRNHSIEGNVAPVVWLSWG